MSVFPLVVSGTAFRSVLTFKSAFKVESIIYGVYSILFFLALHILCSRKRPNYKFHLSCIVPLYALTSVHMALEYALAFMSDLGPSAVYEIVTFRLQPPSFIDNRSKRVFIALRIVFAVISLIADAIIIHRCYVIWVFDRWIMIIPVAGYVCTIAATGAVLFDEQNHTSFIVAYSTTCFTNVVATFLTAGRIMWIYRQSRGIMPQSLERKYRVAIAIVLESGLLYPTSLGIIFVLCVAPIPDPVIWIFIGIGYQGIAPTLIIVRVGLGISIEDVDGTLTSFRAAENSRFEINSNGSAINMRPRAMSFDQRPTDDQRC
ncbi:hypothetical protein C8J56DRAFT_1046966 [Mycena floridula]|nr:hypothetical protein C8J56DRAFT_1046966 [Mycena floridula]